MTSNAMKNIQGSTPPFAGGGTSSSEFKYSRSLLAFMPDSTLEELELDSAIPQNDKNRRKGRNRIIFVGCFLLFCVFGSVSKWPK
jgi:hypothetical protein